MLFNLITLLITNGMLFTSRDLSGSIGIVMPVIHHSSSSSSIALSLFVQNFPVLQFIIHYRLSGSTSDMLL